MSSSVSDHRPPLPTVAGTITEAMVYAAISDVLDPELDEPLLKLGFIDKVEVTGSDVQIIFKLPTFWCSPNFAYLMAADLRDKARTLPGVGNVRVGLIDHCAEDEVTNGINQGQSFAQAFPEEEMEDENLGALRRTFLRKGFLMRQDALLRQMTKCKLEESTIAQLRVRDLQVDEAANVAIVTSQEKLIRLEGVGHHAALYLQRRATLQLPTAPDDPLIINDEGQPLQPGSLPAFLRRSRSIRMNIMFNTSLCKGLFHTRYGADSPAYTEEEEIL